MKEAASPSLNSMNATTITYDPYQHLPFLAYGSNAQPHGERFLSLMHFVESEKFRGVDESYRQYLLTLDDPIDFRLETAGVAQCRRRTDWDDVKGALIRAGIWMQLVQHQEALRTQLLRPDSSSGVELIDDAARFIYGRLVKANQSGGDPLRRVVITGDTTLSSIALFDRFDQIFASRLPDEILVSDESGVAERAREYAIQQYLPVRIFSDPESSPLAEQVMEKASHVFSIGTADTPASQFAIDVLSLAAKQGKVAHHIKWVP